MRIRHTTHLLFSATLLSVLFAVAGESSAGIIYVDNRLGSDTFDGTLIKPTGIESGPVRTIRRALQLAHAGDTLSLAANKTPYYESITLFGPRHSGFGNKRFSIVGNGAVVDGARDVRRDAWRPAEKNLWKITPRRKGHYQLILDDKPVPEHPVSPDARALPQLPERHWCAWKGSMYYRAARLEDPRQLAFRFAVRGTGMSLYRVRDVEVRDITFRHFRIDGANSHDLCKNVTLENVTLIGNGRSGLFVGGSASVLARKCRVEGNRKQQVLIRALGTVQLDQSQISQPPAFVD